MGAYQENLRHIAEPQAPSERDKAVSTTIEDHEALWFAQALREFAHYGEHDPDAQSGIAVGYASYFDQKVREQCDKHVIVYAHTEAAATTLLDALYHYVPDEGENRGTVPMTVVRSLEESFAELVAHFIDDEMGPETPPEPEVDDELGLVFDVDEARDSYADMKIAEAEAEHLQELEEDANARGINNRRTPNVNPNYR